MCGKYCKEMFGMIKMFHMAALILKLLLISQSNSLRNFMPSVTQPTISHALLVRAVRKQNHMEIPQWIGNWK